MNKKPALARRELVSANILYGVIYAQEQTLDVDFESAEAG